MLRMVSQRLGLLPGSGVLFTRSSRLRVMGTLGGMVVLALLEVVAVATTLPLLQVLTGASVSFGPLEPVLRGASTPESQAARLGALVFVAFLVKGVVSIAVRWWSIGFIAMEQVATGEKLMRYYLTAPYSLYLRRGLAELLRVLGDAVTTVYSRVVMGAVGIVAELATIVSLMGVMAWAAPLPTLGVGVYFLSCALVLDRVIRRPALLSGERMLEASIETYRNAVTPLQAIKEVKIRGAADWFAHDYGAARLKTAKAARVAIFLGELPKYVLEIVFIVGIALMAVIAFSTTDRTEAVSLLGLFAVGGFRILPSVNRLLANVSAVRVGRKSLELLLPDLTAATFAPRPSLDPDRARLSFRDDLRIKDLRFAYGPDLPEVLKGVDLTIPAGSSVAIVGGSGSGKSTLVDLVLGLHEPTRGAILCDGVDIHTDLRGWQDNLAVVPQEVYLIDGSIRDNIVFGAPEVDEDQLRQAVDDAQLSDLVDSHPQGLDRPVGEGGGHLSGGQRQRIGIARALYRQPSMLVLDEATSALDNETEHRVTETVRRLSGSVTTIVVAHRLSTLKHCDAIVLLSDGVAVTATSFQDLADSSPEFARLLELASLRSVVGDESLGATS